ncbi:uncharacterized protein LOC112569022 [Pomacea canaliculata]|uniref:uncharacterized protein LOC112569022 n=1 Tax=Pomacea canaliculata TaxID=400727 RepID=UPI000D72C267|nr:uncharacterized protein LOC112569022 [Pomacea canaliculata]
MRRVYSSSMWLVTWMLQLYLPAANIVTGFKATCVVPPAEPLGNTSLTCHFPEDVSKTKKNFIVDVVPENGRTEVALNCFWVRNEMKCYTKQGYSFDQQVSDRITLHIPQVSPEQYGRYNCFFFNISSVYSEACVLEKTAGLSLKLPFYPGDTVMALEKKQLHIAFYLNGVKDRSPGDDVRVVVNKNDVDTLCDVSFVRTTGHVINRSPVSSCSYNLLLTLASSSA